MNGRIPKLNPIQYEDEAPSRQEFVFSPRFGVRANVVVQARLIDTLAHASGLQLTRNAINSWPCKMRIKFSKISALLTTASFLCTALSGEIRPFSQKDFDKLTIDGKGVALHFRASWCPTCRAQKPVLETLLNRPDFNNLTMMTLDYDTATLELKKFKVTMQSTLVVYKGVNEVGRSVGDISPESIERLLRRTQN